MATVAVTWAVIWASCSGVIAGEGSTGVLGDSDSRKAFRINLLRLLSCLGDGAGVVGDTCPNMG